MSGQARPERPPSTYAVVTLGCRANQYDGAAMAADLESAGLFAAAPEQADVVVVNTCMVTGASEAQCRKAVRKVRRANRSARLVLSGCAPGGPGFSPQAWKEADLVLARSERSDLCARLGVGARPAWTDWPPGPAVLGEGHHRATLKIQDGCDGGCSFCIVPSLRGPCRSLPEPLALRAVQDHFSRGVPEVVLSGIRLGRYGTDLAPPSTLASLAVRLMALGHKGRIRFGSIEPGEVTDELVDTMASGSRFCRHLHIPLQSGSDRILRAMGRAGTSDQFVRTVERIRAALPGVGIGCDVICGYPGETDDDHCRTEEIVRSLAIPFVHAFPYSPRPGTRAAALADDVPSRVKRERVHRIRLAAAFNHAAFLPGFVGTTLEVVVEAPDRSTGLPALADNYLRVRLPSRASVRPGDMVRVRVTAWRGLQLIGEPLVGDLDG